MLPLQTQGCSIRLHQPMKRVTKRRGMRLLNRKLTSSCWVSRAMRDLAFIVVSLVCNTVRALRSSRGMGNYYLRLRVGRSRPGILAAKNSHQAAAFPGQAPLAGGPFAYGTPLRLLGAVLRV